MTEQPAFVAALLERCHFPDEHQLNCAVSGGADSMALLVLATATGANVHAVHVDHGLRRESSREAQLVEAAAVRFGATFEAVAVDIEVGPNLEARARCARYAALPDSVLTGHTADDQAETVLLGLLRGSAWTGMSGMDPSGRPLLSLRRSETVGLCLDLGLEVVDDPSNRDLAYRRNRIRHELLPLLTDIGERDPVPVITRQAQLFGQGGEVIAERAEELDVTDADSLASAPEIVAREAVRQWLWAGTKGDYPPDLATVDRVLQVARLEIGATEVGRGWRVDRSNKRLRLTPPH
ncbi:MAG: tRNA lysidine(34) synthetase TilS [Acidimicrobiales bacterium]